MVIIQHRHVPRKNIPSVFHGFVLHPDYRRYRLQLSAIKNNFFTYSSGLNYKEKDVQQ